MEIPIAKIEIIARSTVFTAIDESPYNYIPRLLFEIKFLDLVIIESIAKECSTPSNEIEQCCN